MHLQPIHVWERYPPSFLYLDIYEYLLYFQNLSPPQPSSFPKLIMVAEHPESRKYCWTKEGVKGAAICSELELLPQLLCAQQNTVLLISSNAKGTQYTT